MRLLARLLILLGLVTAPLAPARAQAQAAPSSTPGVATVEFLDVGQGDAALIRSPEGKTALVDAGPARQVVQLLRDRGITTLDLVVVSHHHADHYGGMVAVVRALRPRVFLASTSGHTTPNYLRLLEVIREQGITAIAPTPTSRKIELGSVVLTVFPQPPEDPAEENNNSIGLRVQHGAVALLLTGDSEVAERRWWLEHAPTLAADCAVLKLAHHGSHNGVDARWLGLVKPRLAVASLARGNDYGHPHRDTLALLARLKIPLLRTDEVGTVTIRSDGTTFEVVQGDLTARGPPARREPASGEAPRAKTPAPSSDRVDVNTATAAELEALPGIGPELARRIIEGRPYRAVDDQVRVNGIGQKRLEQLRPLVRTR